MSALLSNPAMLVGLIRAALEADWTAFRACLWPYNWRSGKAA